MLDFKTAAEEEICQLCERGIEDTEVRLRRVYEDVLCVLCPDCLKDNNKWKVVESNRKEGYFGKPEVNKEQVEEPREKGGKTTRRKA